LIEADGGFLNLQKQSYTPRATTLQDAGGRVSPPNSQRGISILVEFANSRGCAEAKYQTA
jgi:hypothetical protein